MRLHGSRSHIQLLDVLRADVHDFVDVLRSSFNQQECGIGHERTILLVEIRVNDRVRDACLVLNRRKDEAVSRRWREEPPRGTRDRNRRGPFPTDLPLLFSENGSLFVHQPAAAGFLCFQRNSGA